ncbi:C40 family peptidase [Calothrix sp. NIES-3974]|uniref:C40 family peptidase n=1 Tax=Calothrix sp. NIES-3974 TaxID=2005462 RepID=UPI000B60DC1D|nr:C40 family peptidase [Calothrix sp. NIES-3974]BAZ08083.1 NLP/P60 protein [Calothrix sp. NIES-3974]
MVVNSQILKLHTQAYQCQADLNIYDSPECKSLATQAAKGRHLYITNMDNETAIQVCLCADGYPGWVSRQDLGLLQVATVAYQVQSLTTEEIKNRLPQVIHFTHQAMSQPNYYLWGGTVGPNYDCSGLMQAAFASVGINLPRDAYQQEAFLEPIPISDLQPGDLVFFGTPQKATHVGLYLGDGKYIHSSGREQGRNGIGIDILSEQGDRVSQSYYKQLRGAGRVVRVFIP